MILFGMCGLILFDRGSRHRKCAVRVSICCPEIDLHGEGRRGGGVDRHRLRQTDRQEDRFDLPEPDFTVLLLLSEVHWLPCVILPPRIRFEN
jgi:hypothetical protein